MADVGSVTNFNSSLPNPLATLTSVMGIANSAQTNQLLQTYNQQRQLELQSGYAKGLYDTISPLVNSPNVTQSQVRAAGANYARQVGIPPAQYRNFDSMLSGPDWQTNLKNLAIRSQGPEGITPRTNIMDPNSGATSAVPSASVIGQGVPTGLPLTAAPSTDKMQKDLSDVGNFQEQIAPLMQMHKEINSLPEGSTGPLTTGILHTVEGIHSIAPGLLKYLPGVSSEQMATRAAYAKYAAQAANNINGRGTDLSLMQTITGNPNPSINDLTDKQLGMFAIAVQRMGAAKTLEASRAGPNADIGTNGVGYINSKAGVASKLDPNAFMYDLISPEERAKLASSLKGKARDNFNYSIHIGQRNQIMNLPGQ